MVKKIILTLTLCPLASINALDDHKNVPKPIPPKPAITLSASGALPVRHILDIPQIPRVTIDAEALTQAAQALKEIKLTINATPEVKVNINSDVLERAAKALSATLDHQLQLKAPEQPIQLQVNLPAQDLEQLTTSVEAVALKCPAGIGCGSLLVYGGHPALMCALGCILITPYSIIKDTAKNSYSALRDQLNRCRASKPPRDHKN